MSACNLILTKQDAAANSAQLVEYTMDGQTFTLVTYKTVFQAGLSQTGNIQIYPSQTLEETKKNLSQVAKDVGAKFSLGDCTNL